MYDVNAIKEYIYFLKREHNLSVTLHINDDCHAVSNELISFNIHDNSYCAFIKTFPDAWQHCIDKQDSVCKKCQNGSFEGVCYAGVKEYVYPIISNGEVVGFICVSGYKSKNASSYINAVSEKYDIPKENLKAVYETLKDEVPKKLVDTLIVPLCQMLELAYLKSKTNVKADIDIIEKVKRYLNRNRSHDVSADDLCKYLSCSRSHISHQFKSKTGQSIREYLTELRLEDAKALLEHSGLSVTEIAYSVGFGSSNYFTNVFKKAFKVSPSEYRKKIRNNN